MAPGFGPEFDLLVCPSVLFLVSHLHTCTDIVCPFLAFCFCFSAFLSLSRTEQPPSDLTWSGIHYRNLKYKSTSEELELFHSW